MNALPIILVVNIIGAIIGLFHLVTKYGGALTFRSLSLPDKIVYVYLWCVVAFWLFTIVYSLYNYA